MKTFKRIFDSNAREWHENLSANGILIHSQIDFVNEILKLEKLVILCDFYDLIGLPFSKESLTMGWRYDPENPDKPVDIQVNELPDNRFELTFTVEDVSDFFKSEEEMGD